MTRVQRYLKTKQRQKQGKDQSRGESPKGMKGDIPTSGAKRKWTESERVLGQTASEENSQVDEDSQERTIENLLLI